MILDAIVSLAILLQCRGSAAQATTAYTCSTCDVVGFSFDKAVSLPGNAVSYRAAEFCMAAQCDSTANCVNQMGVALKCDGTIGNLTYEANHYVCRCGSGTVVSIPPNAVSILGGPITSPLSPQGCSNSLSPNCNSSGAQTCAVYDGLAQECRRLGCVGDCHASPQRMTWSWDVLTCDNMIQGTGNQAYLCNCQGPVDKTLAQSITTPDNESMGGLDTIGTCANNGTLPLPGAAQAVIATGQGVDLSPVLLNASNLG